MSIAWLVISVLVSLVIGALLGAWFVCTTMLREIGKKGSCTLGKRVFYMDEVE